VHQPSLDAGLDLQTARRRLAVDGSPSAATTAGAVTSFDVRLDFHSSSPVRSCCLSYDDERRAIGFDVSVHRLSPGKAGMDG
jgi:hypothetical protein